MQLRYDILFRKHPQSNGFLKKNTRRKEAQNSSSHNDQAYYSVRIRSDANLKNTAKFTLINKF